MRASYYVACSRTDLARDIRSAFALVDAPAIVGVSSGQHALYGWRVNITELVKHLKATGFRIQDVPKPREEDMRRIRDSHHVLDEDAGSEESEGEESEGEESDGEESGSEEALSWDDMSDDSASVDISAAMGKWWSAAAPPRIAPREDDLEGLVRMVAAEIDDDLCDCLKVVDDIVWVTRNYVSAGGSRAHARGIWQIPELNVLKKFATKAGLEAPAWLALDPRVSTA